MGIYLSKLAHATDLRVRSTLLRMAPYDKVAGTLLRPSGLFGELSDRKLKPFHLGQHRGAVRSILRVPRNFSDELSDTLQQLQSSLSSQQAHGFAASRTGKCRQPVSTDSDGFNGRIEKVPFKDVP